MQTKSQPDHEAPATSFSIVLIHLFWMLVGPFTLGNLLLRIAQHGHGWLTGLDVGVWIVVAMMIFARWLDQLSGQAANVYGKPAKWAEFRRYIVILPCGTLLAWIAMNLIGNYL